MNTLNSYLINSAKRNPDHIAIEFGDESISYQKLFDNALGISRVLSSYQSKNIAIHLPKSLNLYYAIFGTLLAGKCYVPLNYHIPHFKFQHIISDSNSQVIITNAKSITKLFPHYDYKLTTEKNNLLVVNIDENTNDIKSIRSLDDVRPSSTNEFINVNTNTPCYLLYTSGSTGSPKGILHTHKSACTFIDWATDKLNMDESDVVAQKIIGVF